MNKKLGTVVISGTSGLLGSHLMGILSRRCIAIGIYRQAPDGKQPGHWASCDLTDSKQIQQLAWYQPDVIIHCAAMTGVDACQRQRAQAYAINTVASRMLAKLAAKIGAHLIYISSDYVFDGNRGWYIEEDTAHPINFYGLTKLAGEKEIQRYASQWTILRTTFFGRHPRGTGMVEWLEDNLSNGFEIFGIANQYFSPLWVGNLAEIIVEVAQRELTGIWHLAATERMSKHNFLLQAARALELPSKLIGESQLEQMDFSAPRPLDTSLSTKKASKFLETPLLSVCEGLEAMVSGTKENQYAKKQP